MKNLSIKIKLIVIFIFIKVIPLLIISFIAYEGVIKLENYLQESTRYLFNKNKEIVLNTANASIEDSIKNLDKKSQLSLERLSFEISKNVANFLYERDKDILFLSKLDLNQDVLSKFNEVKTREIIVHDDYYYDNNDNTWKIKTSSNTLESKKEEASLLDNKKEFNYTNPLNLKKKTISIYKEITFFDLNGKEKLKVSQLNGELLDISSKKNTYISSENYFSEIKNLKKEEIYVSDVIGEYVNSKVIGTFTKQKAIKSKIDFEPEKYAYAGKENPVGKEFQAIVRFITPVFKNNKKIGYVSLALDHKHIMQFTDTSNPTSVNPTQDIADASLGNYAFMWDYEGKNISHARDYFIVGYDKNTGKQAMPWLSLDVAKKYYESNKNINEFLKDYPTFQEQSLSKKPNIRQLLESGNIGLDCRYLNFAPQCEGWMQVTKDGGYGSFIIYWSKVWKLTTAATIPYYTGKYGNTKRGFGFVTIGANVDEFHSASNATKSNVTKILNVQTEQMQEIVNENKNEIEGFIERLINELSVVTLIMLILIIAIAVWMSKYLTSKLEKLLIATKNYSNNDFDYRINVKSNDEIGNLERSFNKMASKISLLIKNQNKLNTELEKKVELKTNELQEINKNLENKINDRTEFLRVALDKAKKADEAKSIFLANISHEIRTPLNAIIGFSDILANTKQENEKNRKYTEIIKSSSNSLLNIINDILDISKIQNGNFELNLDETNINKVSESVIELFLNQAREKHIQLIFNIDNNIPSNIMSDSIRLKQVLTNLLSNAIKFTFEHGKVSLNIYIINENENEITLRFEVIDTGIGIPIENIDNIFQPFIQVEHKATREYQGTGLGLSICNHIVESFNSKINIESSVGKGTKLWFDSTFMKCEDDKKDLNNYAEKLKFKITSSSNDLISHIEKYLNIFGTIENKNPDVLIYPFENIDELKKNREINQEIPTLILFRYENDIKKIELNKNEFAISLPFYSSNVNDSLQELLSKSNNQKLKYNKTLTSTYSGKVLVAEDNIANQELISHILKDMKVDFNIEENGLKCFESYRKNKYDLILMDINMPVLDGISTLNKIRKFEKENNQRKVPIIALTANAIKGDKEKFLNLGMNAYISKPINVNELNALFQKYLTKEIKENDFQETVEKKSSIKSKLDAKLIQTNLGVSEKISFMLIENFKKSIEKDLYELEDLIKNQEIEKVVQKAHYIKNSCLNVYLNDACILLEEFELKNIKPEVMNKKYEELKDIINNAININ